MRDSEGKGAGNPPPFNNWSPMPLPLDPVTLKKLALVKQIYQQAYLQSTARPSPVSRIIAIVTFDLATETVLKAVVSALEPSKNPEKLFQPLLQSADSLLASKGFPPVPDQVQIQHVHSLRNDAQHKAKYPTEIEVSDSRAFTKTFLDNITTQVWGKNFEDISLIDLIQNAEVKALLQSARGYFDSNDYTQCVAYLKVAFELAIGKASELLTGNYPNSSTFDPPEIPKELVESLIKTTTVVSMLALGLDFAEYMRYKHATSSVLSFHTGDNLVHAAITGPEPNEDEARFALNYVVDVSSQIESYVGDLSRPFISSF
jgi:hypothetical protein